MSNLLNTLACPIRSNKSSTLAIRKLFPSINGLVLQQSITKRNLSASAFGTTKIGDVHSLEAG